MGAASSVKKVEAAVVVDAAPQPEKQHVTYPEDNAMPGDDDSDQIGTIFAKDMYVNSTQKVDSLQQVLAHESGRVAFLKFLKTEYADINMQFYADIEKTKNDGNEGAFNDLCEKYTKPADETDLKIPEKTKMTLTVLAETGDASVEDKKKALETAQKDIIQVMAIGAWPRFLMSAAFAEWRTADSGATATVSDAIRPPEGAAAGEGDALATAAAPADGEVVDKIVDGLEDRMTDEFNSILKDQSWLSSLLSTVESLPLCVSVASANQATRGFPLIYVNAFFEHTTGYTRAEILGQNCRFLQQGKEEGQRSEPTSISRLSEALGASRPVKVAITNFRKDGTPFMNLLALKPIVDQGGNYAFVVGIQFDIGENYAAPERLKMVEDLLRALPEKIYSSEQQPSPKANLAAPAPAAPAAAAAAAPAAPPVAEPAME